MIDSVEGDMSRDHGYLLSAAPGTWQDAVSARYTERGYSDDPFILLTGLAEEVGEVAQCLLMQDERYVARPGKDPGDLRHEFLDVLVYLLALANSQGIDLGI